jgi:4-amino-4-deoxy-L-arabinose transferase-like glycosyltransferase
MMHMNRDARGPTRTAQGSTTFSGPARLWVRVRIWLLPAILLLCVTLPHLGEGDWQRGDSGWYTAIGVQAFRTGDLWTFMGEPGQPYFNKPPLVLWITGFVAWIFGPGALAARGPTVLAALGCVLVTVSLVRVFGSRRSALASGIVLALSVEFFRRTREVSMDMWQLLFLLLMLWAVATGVRRSNWKRFALAGVPLGLALLTKPLVALVGVAAVAVWLIGIGRRRELSWLGATTLVSLLIAGPWHVSMILLHGEAFTGTYLGTQILSRAGGRGVTSTTGPLFYLAQLGRNHWPWLIGVVLAIAAMVRPARRSHLAPSTRMAMALAMVWTVLWLALLSAFTDRRDRYGLVLQPGLAILCGVWLASIAPVWVERANRHILRAGLPLAIIGAVVFALVPVRIHRPINPQWPALFAWIEAQRVEAGPGITADARGGLPTLYQGGFRGDHGARLYLETGSWPITTIDRAGRIVAPPPQGALIVYHRRGGRRPGTNESVLFTSGDLTVTRLGAGGWSPIVFSDPGEGSGAPAGANGP